MNVVQSGNLKKAKKGYKMAVLESDHLKPILALQELITSMLPKDIFVPDSDETLARSFLNDDLLLGVFVDDSLIAYRYISFPGESENNLGIDAGVKKKHLDKVATFETSIVHPQYRGNKLQAIMMKKGLEIVKERGARYAVSTVSPKNPYSLKNLIDSGFRVVATKIKYGGVERHIMLNDLGKESTSRMTDKSNVYGRHELNREISLMEKVY